MTERQDEFWSQLQEDVFVAEMEAANFDKIQERLDGAKADPMPSTAVEDLVTMVAGDRAGNSEAGNSEAGTPQAGTSQAGGKVLRFNRRKAAMWMGSLVLAAAGWQAIGWIPGTNPLDTMPYGQALDILQDSTRTANDRRVALGRVYGFAKYGIQQITSLADQGDLQKVAAGHLTALRSIVRGQLQPAMPATRTSMEELVERMTNQEALRKDRLQAMRGVYELTAECVAAIRDVDTKPDQGFTTVRRGFNQHLRRHLRMR